MASRFTILVIWVLVTAFGGVSTGKTNNCSLLQRDHAVRCEPSIISEDACLTMGCCWNKSAAKTLENEKNITDIPCHRSKYLNGTCIQYPETGVCFPYLNSSVPQFRNTPRFIDYNIGLNQTDRLLQGFLRLVTIVAKDEFSDNCVTKIRKVLCQYVLTPCDSEGIPVQICRRDCDVFERECPQTLQKLIGGARVSLDSTKSDFVHLSLPDCRNLNTEEELAKVGRKCYITGLFNYVPATELKDGLEQKTLIMIIVISVACLGIFILIITLLCRRKKRHEASKLDPGTPSLSIRVLGSSPAVSVKDHINQLCADDLLKSQMSVTNIKEIKQYPVDMIAYEKDLGEGQFGQVFQGRAVGLDEQSPENETIVAVKTLKKGSSPEAKLEFDQETLLMNYLYHPNIVRLLAVSAMEEPYCMIFEFMCNGDLSEYLRKSEYWRENETIPSDDNKNYLTEEMLLKMCTDVAKGLQFLASNRLIHRDVATRNCLVADDLTIKIADFGMSRDIYSNNYYKIERETVLPIRWLSPEAVMFGKFTVQSDVYSYGVLLWEVFTFSMQPYYGYTNKEVLDFIRKGIHLAKPDICPDFVYSIMKDCWAMNPEFRPNYQNILNRLDGKEMTYDMPRTWSPDEKPDPPLYQNVNLNQPDPETEASAHNDPLIISTTPPGKSNDKNDGVFLANNPLFNAGPDQDSEVHDNVSANTADDSDNDNNHKNREETKTEQNKDNNFDRINQTTYV